MTITTLGELQKNRTCRVISFVKKGFYRHQMISLGIIPGTTIKMIRTAPLGDPVEFEAHGCHFCLRKCEARCIKVQLLDEESA